MRFVGIRDGKIHDITTSLKNKRDNDNKVKYLETDLPDLCVDDTWENGMSLKDSKRRNTIPVKTKLELKIEELEARIEKLENGIN